LISSVPSHGERIDFQGRATRQLSTFMEDLEDVYQVSSLPDEAEIIFKNGVAELNLVTFMQEVSDAAGLTSIDEGEIIIVDGVASFRFQALLDRLAE